MKNSRTQASYQQRVMRTLVYIQENLTKQLRLDELAMVSHFSPYHFHRIFTAMVGESVYGYIKRLKIQKAAGQCLYAPKKSITTIALDCGFSSSSALTKAFRSVLGVSPIELRKKGSIGDYHNPYLNQLTEMTEVNMNYEITNRSALTMLFVRKTGDYFKTAREAWDRIRQFIQDKKINLNDISLVAYAHDDPAIAAVHACRFDAGIVGLNPLMAQGDIGVQTLVGGRYAVFEHQGSLDKMGDTYRQIYGVWVPQSGYELRDEPAYCEYDKERMMEYGQLSDDERASLVTKIYLPIV